ncbi:hypothetical protein GLI01_16290 [Gluconacetobacter liquefaciens]|uniref:Uncharacterized protein n=1 Tax=Gluconacetobacter liquefaciens TaxID=89584 RepID=A0A370G7N8_GLULI|nr:DUF6587 family protein [Gluconacetobacter liquefaciens]MBB2185993.1 hypothetical protein [Gluconacetobacter liquefaciens]RDI39811.1 hypothetical protein C7453_102607 [Gluconacetobacter liquefaciens]GEB37594.1 hypothetical protein GLI01_16290 [Gluconacetobacter liquefaciens]
MIETIVETIVIVAIVTASALYWVRRLVPASQGMFWRTSADMLRVIHAPRPLRDRATQRARQTEKRPTGCGACTKCGGGGCH